MTPRYDNRKICTNEQESQLGEYLLACCRRLAYETAIKNNLTIPDTWVISKLAGIDWLQGFMERNKHLTLRLPEARSIARATSFNKYNVKIFFDKLSDVMSRNPGFANGSRLYNLDETGVTTVQTPRKVIGEKGARQVHQITSGEKGSLVTVCCIIGANGNSLPPAMVFPRVHFKPHMINDAPANTLGLATQSGWMTAELFVEVIRHFIKYTCSSKSNPTLLLYDNHESHLSIDCLDLAKDNGVTILTLPPHCSDKMEPLDVAVFAPFKTYYNAAVKSWLDSHATPLTIYQIAGCVKPAWERSMTPQNIIAGFQKTGIFPFDKDIFTDADFLASNITDRPAPQNNSSSVENSHQLVSVFQQENPSTSSFAQEIPSTITGNITTLPDNRKTFIAPSEFKGYPRAGPRKLSNRGRKRGKCIIATDTPEKNEIASRSAGLLKKKKPTRKLKPKKLFSVESEESDEPEMLSSSSVSSFSETFSNLDNPEGFDALDREPKEGDLDVYKRQV